MQGEHFLTVDLSRGDSPKKRWVNGETGAYAKEDDPCPRRNGGCTDWVELYPYCSSKQYHQFPPPRLLFWDLHIDGRQRHLRHPPFRAKTPKLLPFNFIPPEV